MSQLDGAPSGELFMLSLADFFAGSEFGSAFVAERAPIERIQKFSWNWSKTEMLSHGSHG